MSMQTEPIAEGEGWRIRRFTCTSGPGDRPFEERHDCFSLSLVSRGSFEYRAGSERASLVAGAILLGNSGTCFQCSHDHSRGDECLSFQYDAECMEEVVGGISGVGRLEFPRAVHPPDWALSALQAQAESLRRNDLPEMIEEMAFRIAGAVVCRSHATDSPGEAVLPRDRRRIVEAALVIEEGVTEVESEALSLGQLARGAGMTRYRFLRLFRRLIGLTPHQFILRSRMQRSATRLVTTSEPISAIAFESGFGDLSTFNRQFRRAMGVPPTDFRNAGIGTNIRIGA